MRSQGLNFKSPVEFLKKKKVQGITFTRNSIAYDASFNQIPANVPRFNQGSLGKGLLIEEATTNLFPADKSQSFTGAWTSGTLNGTYTVSINAGGSLTLSGGATGTCASGGTLTFTVSNAAVTFTPTGTPTHSQLELKAYPTSWTLGGTTRALETCAVPANVMNLSQWTIECEVYVNNAIKNTGDYHSVFKHGTGLNRISISHNSGSSGWGFRVTDNTGAYSEKTAIDTLSIGNHKFIIAGNVTTSTLICLIDGNIIYNGNYTNWPTVQNVIRIFGTDVGAYWGNTFMHNFVISKIQRPITELQVRGNPNILGFTIDKNVTLAMPNLNDLRAYYETVAV